MRALWSGAVAMAATVGLSQQAVETSGGYTLKISVSNVNQEGGNIGVLVFNSARGAGRSHCGVERHNRSCSSGNCRRADSQPPGRRLRSRCPP